MTTPPPYQPPYPTFAPPSRNNGAVWAAVIAVAAASMVLAMLFLMIGLIGPLAWIYASIAVAAIGVPVPVAVGLIVTSRRSAL